MPGFSEKDRELREEKGLMRKEGIRENAHSESGFREEGDRRCSRRKQRGWEEQRGL